MELEQKMLTLTKQWLRHHERGKQVETIPGRLAWAIERHGYWTERTEHWEDKVGNR